MVLESHFPSEFSSNTPELTKQSLLVNLKMMASWTGAQLEINSAGEWLSKTSNEEPCSTWSKFDHI